MPNPVDLLIERYEKATGQKPPPVHRPNMFDPSPNFVQVTRCRECKNSFTPMTVIPGSEDAAPTVRCCLLTGRVKRDDGYCDEGSKKDDA